VKTAAEFSDDGFDARRVAGFAQVKKLEVREPAAPIRGQRVEDHLQSFLGILSGDHDANGLVFGGGQSCSEFLCQIAAAGRSGIFDERPIRDFTRRFDDQVIETPAKGVGGRLKPQIGIVGLRLIDGAARAESNGHQNKRYEYGGNPFRPVRCPTETKDHDFDKVA
jgi:hypothetical protein